MLVCKYVLRCSRVSQPPNCGYAASGILAFSLRRMPPRPATDDPSTRPGYLRKLANELGFTQSSPTTLYEDCCRRAF